MTKARITVDLPKDKRIWRVLAVANGPRSIPEVLQIVGPVTFSNGKRAKRSRRKSK